MASGDGTSSPTECDLRAAQGRGLAQGDHPVVPGQSRGDLRPRPRNSVRFSQFKLPSVIRLLRYITIRRHFNYVPFSRVNIYARDNHRCQYCGKGFPVSELTFDHVVPVSQGGRKDWENIVTSCITCNRRKGGRTPAQAHMRVIRQPRRPTRAPIVRLTIARPGAAHRGAGGDDGHDRRVRRRRPSRLLKNTRIGLFSWPSCVSRPPRQRCARGHAVPTRGPATPAAGDQGHLASRFRNRTKL